MWKSKSLMTRRNVESHFSFSFDSFFRAQYCQPRMTFWHLISFYCYFLWSRENPLQKASPEPGFYSRPNIRSDDDSVSSLSELHLQGVQNKLAFRISLENNVESDHIFVGDDPRPGLLLNSHDLIQVVMMKMCGCDVCVIFVWRLCLCVVESPSSKWRWDIFEVTTLPDNQIK